MPFLRRVRAVAVTAALAAVTWGVIAPLLFLLVAFATGGTDDFFFGVMLRAYTMMGLALGAAGGAAFALTLALAERSGTVARLSVKRAALWGTLAGVALPTAIIASRLLALSGLSLSTGLLAFLGINAAIGAATAAGAVAIAKQGALSAGELESGDAVPLVPRTVSPTR